MPGAAWGCAGICAEEIRRQLLSTGSFWALRINDVTVRRGSKAQDTNFTLPVNAYLQSDRSEISLPFVSVAGNPYRFNVATPDFYFLSEMQRLGPSSRERRRTTLLNLALDEGNRVISPEKTRFGQPVWSATRPPMLLPGGSSGRQGFADGWGGAWTGRQVGAVFELDAPLPKQPWAAAPVLKETPELRAKLLAAYRELHAALASGNGARAYASSMSRPGAISPPACTTHRWTSSSRRRPHGSSCGPSIRRACA